jgi:hypothetical protein
VPDQFPRYEVAAPGGGRFACYALDAMPKDRR